MTRGILVRCLAGSCFLAAINAQIEYKAMYPRRKIPKNPPRNRAPMDRAMIPPTKAIGMKWRR